jgi:hypothetical protein
MHDGIPFLQLGDKDNSWFINPTHIIRVIDASKETIKSRKLKSPSAIIYLVDGIENGYGIEGMTAAQVVEKINKTMTEWKHKLADKALLND